MILLSETSTNKYYGIESDRNEEMISIPRELLLKGKILGIISPEDSIPEEIGAEMFEDYYDLGMSTYHRIKNKLEPKGILIENPIEKPNEKCNYISYGDYCDPNICNCNKKMKWQSYESKLKKVVIIKTQK